MPLQSGFWRKWCGFFRWFRFGVMALVFVLICAGAWLDRVGLPDFLKGQLVETLRTRGIQLEFTRLRLRIIHGLVAENVRLGLTETPGGPALSLAEVELQLNYGALLHRQLQVDGLVLHEGKFAWLLAPANKTPRLLVLDHIQTNLRFQADDTWALDNFRAEFAGARLALSGGIAHAPEIRNWKMFQANKTSTSDAGQEQLWKILDTLNRIHLEGPSQLSLLVNGDARDIHSFFVRLNITTSSMQTPWGGMRHVQLAAQLTAPGNAPVNPSPSWGWWTNMAPFRLTWTVQLEQLKTEKLDADSLTCRGSWQAPELVVTNLSVQLGGGQLDASARLNVATREFTFTNSSCFDVHVISSLLTEQMREHLAQFSCTNPPSLHAAGSLVLPPWVTPMRDHPDWLEQAQPTLRLDGSLALTNGSFGSVTIHLARARFACSNLIWQLPDSVITTSNGRLELSGSMDSRTKDYRCHIRGAVDMEMVRQFLASSETGGDLDNFSFETPPMLDMDVDGQLHDFDSIGASGHVALTNFTVNGQQADNVTSELFYKNRVLQFFHPRLERAKGTQIMVADRVTVDFNTERVYFTNGFSTADPLAAARAIGPKTGQVMEPYHFLKPPAVHFNGYAPLHGETDADLLFNITGGAPFKWLKLRSSNVTGTVHWMGQLLSLTNVAAAFYGGRGKGYASFDFRPAHEGADYEFAFTVTNVNLHSLAADLSSPTNHLEGVLAGWLVVTYADSRDCQTWNGFGHANLRDGLLWDIPVFGILSPVLNTVSPGLGNSRATDATAWFTITNGVFYTDSLEIRSTMMHLQYAGTVDMKENVNARVTAQLLRDTWVVGPLVSTMLWPVSKLFEYQVTGTLGQPEKKPVHVPKLLLMPLHPIRSLEEMFPPGAGLNAPSGN